MKKLLIALLLCSTLAGAQTVNKRVYVRLYDNPITMFGFYVTDTSGVDTIYIESPVPGWLTIQGQDSTTIYGNLHVTGILSGNVEATGDSVRVCFHSDVADSLTNFDTTGIVRTGDLAGYQPLSTLGLRMLDTTGITTNKILKFDGTKWAMADDATGAGSVDTATLLRKDNNLSALTDKAASRTNLGVAIGTNVQAWDAQLDDLSDLSATGQLQMNSLYAAAGADETIPITGKGYSVSHSGNMLELLAYNGTGLFKVNYLGTVTTGAWDGTDIPVTAGGTGASTAADARTNLGAWGAADSANYLRRDNNLASLSNASSARTNLGLAIGTNVQAWDTQLDDVADFTITSGVLNISSNQNSEAMLTLSNTGSATPPTLILGNTTYGSWMRLYDATSPNTYYLDLKMPLSPLTAVRTIRWPNADGTVALTATTLANTDSAGYLRKDNNLAALTNAAAARTNLGAWGYTDSANYLRRDNNLSSLTSTSAARTNLGLAIGTNVQAWDAQLDDLSDLTATGQLQMSSLYAAAGADVTIPITGKGYSASHSGNMLELLAYNGTALFVVSSTGVVTTGQWDGTDIPVTAGGTGSSTAADARTALGLAIGTNVHPYDATLASIDDLGTAADRYAYTTGVDTWAEGTITSAGRSILDDANVGAIRNTMGIGTADSPTFSTLTLSNGLAVSSGGTGVLTFTTNGIPYGNGTSAMGVTAAGVDGKYLSASAAGVPEWVDLYDTLSRTANFGPNITADDSVVAFIAPTAGYEVIGMWVRNGGGSSEDGSVRVHKCATNNATYLGILLHDLSDVTDLNSHEETATLANGTLTAGDIVTVELEGMSGTTTSLAVQVMIRKKK